MTGQTPRFPMCCFVVLFFAAYFHVWWYNWTDRSLWEWDISIYFSQDFNVHPPIIEYYDTKLKMSAKHVDQGYCRIYGKKTNWEC